VGFIQDLKPELEILRRKDQLRDPYILEGPNEAVIRIGNQELVSFCSNNYLALAQDPRVIDAAKRSIEKYGAGSGASRLVSGTLEIHRRLEDELAEFEGRPRSLVFTSGYQANLSLVTSLIGALDVVFCDRLNHASLIQAARLSRAKFQVYPHKDMDRLAYLLKQAQGSRRRLVITDGVFSMDGDLAPLREIDQLCSEYDAEWMVDEAHGTGVLGKQGKGAHEYLGLDRKGIVMGTLSKALGSLGGFICGESSLIRFLENKAKPFIYTTALAPSCVGAARQALKIIQTEPERRIRLREVSKRVRDALRSFGFTVLGHFESPIIPVVIGSVTATMKLAKHCFNQGLLIPGIRPPTVPDGESRLRITLMSTHSDRHIEKLVEVFSDVSGDLKEEDQVLSTC
jgi:8-amino-7-oxononanoate synthase